MEEIKELEIGECVRDKNGNIDKIENYSLGCCVWHCVKGMCIDRCNTVGTHLTDIVKHSKNIIDLIEIGDYVNGYSIDNIINGVLVHRANGIDRSGYLIPIIQYENDIKSIVTKEQFASLEYRI